MPSLRSLSAAAVLIALGVTGTALAEQPANPQADTAPSGQMQDSESNSGLGGSVQVPGARDGADKTNPYDELGPDNGDEHDEPVVEDSQPINE